MKSILGFLGRLCFSLIFIVAGITKIFNWDATEQYLANQMIDVLSKSYQYGFAQILFDAMIPMTTTLLVLATVAEILGGLLILTGLQVRLGALILLLYLIPTTLLFHNFWILEGSARELQTTMFLKNLSIFGGALLLLAFGKGTSREVKKSK